MDGGDTTVGCVPGATVVSGNSVGEGAGLFAVGNGVGVPAGVCVTVGVAVGSCVAVGVAVGSCVTV
ncbi:MAG TPA: hypothetical protein PLI31_03570, partial [Methanoregulaceae archaeon]|nr:hypothetical protein [Methanoregulaceae archaeon]